MSKSKAVKTIEENKRRTFLATEITKPLNLSTISISKAINPSRNDSYTLTSITTTRYFLSKNSDFISKEGITLYKKGTTKKIIMSGDHSREDYDEVKIMKEYAESEGVSSEDIFMDHAGFSSYDSVYRAKEIFGVQNMIIVTQKYHLYRSLYIAKKLGIEAYGIESNLRTYPGQVFREIREILARDKDYFKCIMKPEASIMGEKISLDGSGDITND